MSRIGRLPIKIPTNVKVICDKLMITVEGKFGTLQKIIPNELGIVQKDNKLFVNVVTQTKTTQKLHGLYRTLINNMIVGVSEQFRIKLQLKGVGYRAALKKDLIILNLGYSHPIEIVVPNGTSVEISQNINIQLIGCDKEKLGLFAAKIRSWRLPEPYKGKGILYEGEIVKMKAGKSGKK
jgi:large subunit ribosomal protein L6